MIDFESLIEYNSNIEEFFNEEKLFCDIETKSLELHLAEVLTISFTTTDGRTKVFPTTNQEDRLKEFISSYPGSLVFHNAVYDVPVLIFQWWMNKSYKNLKGMVQGIKAFKGKVEDSKIIAYLCTNSAGVKKVDLGLKSLISNIVKNTPYEEYFKEYKINIANLTEVSKELLLYNAKDTQATGIVYSTYYTQMVNENQEDVYKFLLKTLMVNIRMRLSGFPLIKDEVISFNESLNQEEEECWEYFNNSTDIKKASEIITSIHVKKRNSKLKTKQITAEDEPQEWNPNSVDHIAVLLYDVLGYEPTEFTSKSKPSTDSKTIKHYYDLYEHPLLEVLIRYKEMYKVRNTFLPVMMRCINGELDIPLLSGSLNIGSTVSGRLSSSGSEYTCNCQQLPSTGTRLAKAFKSTIGSIDPEWILVGFDFASLEERINTILTKDPHKEIIYTQGYDGHSYRAYYYFKDQMPDIQLAEPGEECYLYNGKPYKKKELIELGVIDE